MESDTPLVVNLEVTVPRIVLSALKRQTGKMDPAVPVRAAESRDNDMVEQVRLLPLGLDQQPIIARDSSERMNNTVRFRVFRLNMVWIGKPLLLQVLRRWNGGENQNRSEESRISEGHEGLYAAEASAFSLDFRRRNEDAEAPSVDAAGYAQQVPLEASLNHVVIYLDNEGMPASYSLDGAES